MTTQQMKCFMAVASCGSFTTAAEQLFLSQSAVSYHVRSLEKEYGFALFERDSHGVNLSPAGESFYRAMLVISEEYLSAIDRARHLQKRDDHQIRICFACPTSSSMMGKILSRIAAVTKEAEFTLINRTYYDTMQPVLTGEADILLTYPGFFREGLDLSKKKIASAYTTCLVSPNHPLSRHRTLTLPELAEHTFLLPELQNAKIEFDHVYRWVQKNKAEGLHVDSSPQTLDQAQGLAAAGRGIIFVHTLESEYQRNIDGLVGIPMVDIPPTPFLAVWNSSTLGRTGTELIKMFEI